MIEDGELTHEATEVLADVLVSWMMFKEKHEPLKFCCDSSTRLFDALNRYEKFMLGNEDGGK